MISDSHFRLFEFIPFPTFSNYFFYSEKNIRIMAGGKKAQNGKNGKKEEIKQSEVFQAFVICEDFGQNYQV